MEFKYTVERNGDKNLDLPIKVTFEGSEKALHTIEMNFETLMREHPQDVQINSCEGKLFVCVGTADNLRKVPAVEGFGRAERDGLIRQAQNVIRAQQQSM